MAREEGRTLAEAQTQEPLRKQALCLICLESLSGYHRSEVESNHIYSYADGNPQYLSNLGPVGAPSSDQKRKCHAAKGGKLAAEYREEVRIKKVLQDVTGEQWQSRPVSNIHVSPVTRTGDSWR
jgi:hypothetical protein